ncbi:hypothetical protein [Planococcus donghaensis]|uniref:DUF3951 domain-containing protein n=1 Tax=Planococcus donghaensis TaxID=414778 RepID=A0A1C7ELG0_9BACL|nr:hypothetical protein [Planococcus donghaensis]ANU24471.1 hypothetical protein BCM40_14420 [Planococcus donghaensis]
MDFLYFPDDKSEYIPGIISVVIIFILSVLIVRLLIRASRKQVKSLEDQGYPVVYKDGFEDGKTKDEMIEPQKAADRANEKNMHEKKET